MKVKKGDKLVAKYNSYFYTSKTFSWVGIVTKITNQYIYAATIRCDTQCCDDEYFFCIGGIEDDFEVIRR